MPNICNYGVLRSWGNNMFSLIYPAITVLARGWNRRPTKQMSRQSCLSLKRQLASVGFLAKSITKLIKVFTQTEGLKTFANLLGRVHEKWTGRAQGKNSTWLHTHTSHFTTTSEIQAKWWKADTSVQENTKSVFVSCWIFIIVSMCLPNFMVSICLPKCFTNINY